MRFRSKESVFILLFFLLMLGFMYINTLKPGNLEIVAKDTVVVKSVTILEPGRINSLQTSPVYEYTTSKDSSVRRSINRIEIGDTIVYYSILRGDI